MLRHPVRRRSATRQSIELPPHQHEQSHVPCICAHMVAPRFGWWGWGCQSYVAHPTHHDKQTTDAEWACQRAGCVGHDVARESRDTRID